MQPMAHLRNSEMLMFGSVIKSSELYSTERVVILQDQRLEWSKVVAPQFYYRQAR